MLSAQLLFALQEALRTNGMPDADVQGLPQRVLVQSRYTPSADMRALMKEAIGDRDVLYIVREPPVQSNFRAGESVDKRMEKSAIKRSTAKTS